MALLLNGAGASAGDPILKNLGMTWFIAASTMDIASLVDTWIDQAAGFPGTTSVKSSLSPAATVLTSGTNASYDDTTKRYTISSTTGLSVGDFIYLSHASLTAGGYKILALPAAGQFTLETNPLNGQGNKTNISYQVGWHFDGTAGTSPIVSSSGGQINYFKVRAQDSAANQTDAVDTAYVRDAPATATDFISIDSKAYTGQTTNNPTPSIAILQTWTNNGGISHVEFAAHSVQTGNSDFRHSDGTLGEKTLTTTESNGLSFTAGDGHKYGRILLKAKSGGVSVGVDLDMSLDSTGPSIVMSILGR